MIVLGQPGIEVGLQLVDRGVNSLAQRDPMERVEQGLVEALDDAVRPRALRPGPAMVDVLDGQVELVFMPVVGAAVLGAAAGRHPLQHDAVLVVERDHPVVAQVGGGERCPAVVRLGEPSACRRSSSICSVGT